MENQVEALATDVSSVQLVKIEIELPKELKEVADAVVEILADVLAKKGAAAIASENLPLLMKAGDNIGASGAEFKHPAVYNLGGYVAGRLAQVLLAKKS